MKTSDAVRIAGLDTDAYLRRIGVDPTTVDEPDLHTLERLQRAHVTAVPFENLAIVGDPESESNGEGVDLDVAHLYEKIVERKCGGYCFELNGLFHWLLEELGYDVRRVAARVVSDVTTPANHHANVVQLDRRYVVEVGTGVPMMRRPAPLDGDVRTDEVGVAWRVAASDRPDEGFRTEFRGPGDEEWTTRYVFSDESRDLDYFRAANDHLQSAPESPFTDDPIVAVATGRGHRKLSGTTLTEVVGEREFQRDVPYHEWHATIGREFGLRYAHG